MAGKRDTIRTLGAWNALPEEVRAALEKSQGSFRFWKEAHFRAAEAALAASGMPVKLWWVQGENPANGILVASQANPILEKYQEVAQVPVQAPQPEAPAALVEAPQPEPQPGVPAEPAISLLDGLETVQIQQANGLPSYLRSIGDLGGAMLGVGYHLRQKEGLPTYAALRRWKAQGEACCILALGAPGTGKTYLFESLARVMGAKYVEYNCNSWTTDEPLIQSVNVQAFADSVATNTRQNLGKLGFLSWIAQASQSGLVVACLDELDKAPEEAESLLLRFLENGRINLGEGQFIQANLSNLIIGATSNRYRVHQEATLRRFSPRITMDFLPRQVEESLITKALRSTGIKPIAHSTLAEKLVDAIQELRKIGVSSPSIKEAMTCAQDLEWAQGLKDVNIILEALLTKEPEEASTTGKHAPAIWNALEKANQQQVEKPVADRKIRNEDAQKAVEQVDLSPLFNKTRVPPVGTLIPNKYHKPCRDTGVSLEPGKGFAMVAGHYDDGSAQWINLSRSAVAARLNSGQKMILAGRELKAGSIL